MRIPSADLTMRTGGVFASKCVSEDESAAWLIDYWCGKDVAGIIRMPFTRHLIMHIKAMMRIARKIGIEI